MAQPKPSQAQEHDHGLPFHLNVFMPRFPYVAHDGFSKIVFALIVGGLLGGIIYAAYLLITGSY